MKGQIADWRTRLDGFLAAAARRPFAWGRHDCCLFAADWVLEIAGVDPAAAFRGRYTTPRGALRALKRYGTGDLVGTVSAALGRPPWHGPLYAQRGDLVAVASELAGWPEPTLGVIGHTGVIHLLTEPAGLARRPLRQAVAAWPVDC